MADWDSDIIEESGADFNFYVLPPEEQDQGQFSAAPSVDRSKLSDIIEEESGTDFNFYVLPPEGQDKGQFSAAPSMDRSKLSGSSMDSRRSTGSYQDQNYAESPLTSYGSPQSEGGFTPQYGYLSPETAAPSREPSAELPPFNIERDGDPRIEWVMYYNFIVTKTAAYYQLQPGYLPTEKYPSRVLSEKIMKNGDKLHPCRVPDCKSEPFTRHYDLDRHFKIHQGDKEQVNCDYKKCPHKEPFRKDHCREHYREYHAEDLVKRGSLKHSKSKQGQKKPETVEEFLAARLDNINLSWWRCSKCVQRVQVNDHGYKCPKCNIGCESVRVAWREKALASGKGSQAADSITSFSSASSNCVTSCGECENTCRDSLASEPSSEAYNEQCLHETGRRSPRPRRQKYLASDSGIWLSISSEKSISTSITSQEASHIPSSLVGPKLMGARSHLSGDSPRLSAGASNRIHEYILWPILEKSSLNDFHPILQDISRRIHGKEIVCLRDLEKTLVFYALEKMKSAELYLDFCLTSIRCIQATVEFLNEQEQTRSYDRPYTNGYFVDLVDQIKANAQQIRSSDRDLASREKSLYTFNRPAGSEISSLGQPVSDGALDVRHEENDAGGVADDLTLDKFSRIAQIASSTTGGGDCAFGFPAGVLVSAIQMCYNAYKSFQDNTYNAWFKMMTDDIQNPRLILLQLEKEIKLPPSNFKSGHDEKIQLLDKSLKACHATLKELMMLLESLSSSKHPHKPGVWQRLKLEGGLKLHLERLGVNLKHEEIKLNMILSAWSVPSWGVQNKALGNSIASGYSPRSSDTKPLGIVNVALLDTGMSAGHGRSIPKESQCLLDTGIQQGNFISKSSLLRRLTAWITIGEPQVSMGDVCCEFTPADGQKAIDDIMHLLIGTQPMERPLTVSCQWYTSYFQSSLDKHAAIVKSVLGNGEKSPLPSRCEDTVLSARFIFEAAKPLMRKRDLALGTIIDNLDNSNYFNQEDKEAGNHESGNIPNQLVFAAIGWLCEYSHLEC